MIGYGKKLTKTKLKLPVIILIYAIYICKGVCLLKLHNLYGVTEILDLI